MAAWPLVGESALPCTGGLSELSCAAGKPGSRLAMKPQTNKAAAVW